uniref:Dof-type domain-containing protein n=1 Tax=Globodera pallida TaxID=36090 RepID=A0A183BYV9_GLOPA
MALPPPPTRTRTRTAFVDCWGVHVSPQLLLLSQQQQHESLHNVPGNRFFINDEHPNNVQKMSTLSVGGDSQKHNGTNGAHSAAAEDGDGGGGFGGGGGGEWAQLWPGTSVPDIFGFFINDEHPNNVQKMSTLSVGGDSQKHNGTNGGHSTAAASADDGGGSGGGGGGEWAQLWRMECSRKR